MLDLAERHDFLSLDPETVQHPYDYMEKVREKGPVWQEPFYGVYFVTGYEEIMSAAKRTDVFSSAVAVGGPFIGLNTNRENVKQVVQEFREELARENGRSIGSNVLTDDPPEHARYRSLLNQIFTPTRMKEVGPLIEATANMLLDRFIADGKVEVVQNYSQPLAYGTIADLLGMPAEDREPVLQQQLAHPSQGSALVGTPENAAAFARNQGTPFAEEYFDRYLRERRENPIDDQLSKLATITFPDGSLPPHNELVSIAVNLFAAGQDSSKETTTGLLRYLAQNPDVADRLRANEEEIKKFVDEGLRWISPAKLLFRIAMEDAEIGGVPIPAGSIVALAWMAANRDPKVFQNPEALDPARSNSGRHLAFGFGTHFCIGHILAKVQVQTALRLFLQRTKRIWLDEEHPPVPLESWLLNGWESLHLKFEPA